MKKIFLMVLCLFLVTGSAQAGAGGNSAKQDNPRQAGNSPIYFYDIQSKSPDSNGHGTLILNTDKKTFTFIGQDFTPMRDVHIKVDMGSEFQLIAEGKSTKTGNLHIQGSWEGTLPEQGTVGAYSEILPAYGFKYSNRGYYVAHVKVKWSNDGGVTWNTTSDWGEAVAINEDITQNIRDIDPNIPLGSLVKFKLSVVLGSDVIDDEIYKYVASPGLCYPIYTSYGGPQSAWLIQYDPGVECYIGGGWCWFGTGCYFDY